jgi:hypothetical protein
VKKITLLALLALTLTSCMPNYSIGERVGVINKISYKGMIFESWEGTLIQGGVRSDANGASVANTMDFSVRDAKLIERIQAAAEAQTPVKLYYRQYLIGPPTIGSNYVIYDIKELNQ